MSGARVTGLLSHLSLHYFFSCYAIFLTPNFLCYNFGVPYLVGTCIQTCAKQKTTGHLGGFLLR